MGVSKSYFLSMQLIGLQAWHLWKYITVFLLKEQRLIGLYWLGKILSKLTLSHTSTFNPLKKLT